MTYKSSTIKGSGGIQLGTHYWPAVMPKATLLIVHGYAEHGYRYNEFAKFLNESGIEVYAYDQRGHGVSEGLKAYIESFDVMVDDLNKVIQNITNSDVKRPFFLMGHSMGGLVVTKYCIERQPDFIKGVITSGAALKLDEDLSPMLQMLAPLLAFFFPKMKTEPLDKKYLTRSPDNLKSYMSDPLNYLEGTRARTGAEMIKTIKDTSKKLDQFRLSLLAMHGTGEKLTDPKGTKALYEQSINSDKTLKLYDGLYHELIHEPEKEMVMNDILCWIEERL